MDLEVLEFKEKNIHKGDYDTSGFIITNKGTWIADFSSGEPEWTLVTPEGKRLEFKRNYSWNEIIDFLRRRKKGNILTFSYGSCIRIEGENVVVGLKPHVAVYSSVDDLIVIMIKLLTIYW